MLLPWFAEAATAAGNVRARLAQQVHKATFKGYLDVQEPKSLPRGLLAA